MNKWNDNIGIIMVQKGEKHGLKMQSHTLKDLKIKKWKSTLESKFLVLPSIIRKYSLYKIIWSWMQWHMSKISGWAVYLHSETTPKKFI
jgi:hypothetical protein